MCAKTELQAQSWTNHFLPSHWLPGLHHFMFIHLENKGVPLSRCPFLKQIWLTVFPVVTPQRTPKGWFSFCHFHKCTNHTLGGRGSRTVCIWNGGKKSWTYFFLYALYGQHVAIVPHGKNQHTIWCTVSLGSSAIPNWASSSSAMSQSLFQSAHSRDTYCKWTMHAHSRHWSCFGLQTSQNAHPTSLGLLYLKFYFSSNVNVLEQTISHANNKLQLPLVRSSKPDWSQLTGQTKCD